jgi:hypothetical protein
MSNERITAEITETVAMLGGTLLFDIAEVAAQCDDSCHVMKCPDAEAWIIRSKNGTPLFMFDTSMGCVDAVRQ